MRASRQPGRARDRHRLYRQRQRKTTAAFGTATRAVGHGQKVGVIQFIKGEWPNGERNLLEPHGVEFQVMATGFTWDTQNRETDTAACLAVWEHAKNAGRSLAEYGSAG
jgi:cob(I)alamin adenosyltransferase